MSLPTPASLGVAVELQLHPVRRGQPAHQAGQVVVVGVAVPDP